VGASTALGSDHDDGAGLGAYGADGRLKETEVGVVDVEVDDYVSTSGEEPGSQRPSVVGLG